MKVLATVLKRVFLLKSSFSLCSWYIRECQ